MALTATRRITTGEGYYVVDDKGNEIERHITTGDGELVLENALVATARRTVLVTYRYSNSIREPPQVEEIRFNRGQPYTDVTKVWMRHVTLDGVDVFAGLMAVPNLSTLLVQHKSDHTKYVRFLTIGVPVDKGAYVEFAVKHTSHGDPIGEGDPVIAQAIGAATQSLTQAIQSLVATLQKSKTISDADATAVRALLETEQ